MIIVANIYKNIVIALVVAIVIINLPANNQLSRFTGSADAFSIAMEDSSTSFKAKQIGFLANTSVFYSLEYINIEYNNRTTIEVVNSPIQIDYNKKMYQTVNDAEVTLYFDNVKIIKDYISNDARLDGELNRSIGDYAQLKSEEMKFVITKDGINRVSIGGENVTDFKQISFKMNDRSFAHFFTDNLIVTVNELSEFKSKGKLSKIELQRGEGILGLNNNEFRINNDDFLNIEMLEKHDSQLSVDDRKITFYGITDSTTLNNENILINAAKYMLKFKPEKINAYATLLLAFITILYVVFTGQIVEQTKKNLKHTENIITESKNERKIAFIMKRLEAFYYPLQNFLLTSVADNTRRNPNVVPRQLSIPAETYRNKKDNKNYKDFIDHQYLAENHVDGELQYFLKHILTNAKTQDIDKLDHYDELVMLIGDDIDSLKKDLMELLSS